MGLMDEQKGERAWMSMLKFLAESLNRSYYEGEVVLILSDFKSSQGGVLWPEVSVARYFP